MKTKILKNSLLVLGGLTALNVVANIAQKAYSATNGSLHGAGYKVGGIAMDLLTPVPLNALLASLESESGRSSAAYGCQRSSIADAASS